MAFDPFRNMADQELIAAIKKISAGAISSYMVASLINPLTFKDIQKLLESVAVDTVRAYQDIKEKRAKTEALN